MNNSANNAVTNAANNANLCARAARVIAGGVNSPVRAFKAVGGEPIFIARAQGAYLYAEDGGRYIDYVGSWGPMILGHADANVVEAVQQQAARGLSYGAPTVLETELAELICQQLPWLEQVRMVNSGTEATMSAIRLARAITSRDKILKFAGCYHGHADSLLVKAGSGALTLGVPDSPGVPAATAADTVTAEYNDLAGVTRIFTEIGSQLAALIVEPVAGNMNCVPPRAGFLAGLRALCDQYGTLLIMDEVMSGFRVGPQGAQGCYEVYGDLTTLGKIIGGGMPVGAFGGRREYMAQLAPEGAVYQAGTLSGNPLAMAAGIATLKQLAAPNFYPRLAAKTTALVDGILGHAAAHGVAMVGQPIGSMFGLFFTAHRPTCLAEVMACDTIRFKHFFHAMLKQGIYLAPSAFEAGFVSATHSDEDIAHTVAAAARALGEPTDL